MNNGMKKALVICLCAAMSVTIFGCKKKEEGNTLTETIDINQTKTELTFNYRTEGESAPAQDNQEPANTPEEEKPVETKIIVEEVTEYVAVTDAGGQAVMEADGQPKTEPVVVETRNTAVTPDGKPLANDTNSGGSSSGSGSGSGSEDNSFGGGSAVSEYTPAYDSCKAYWLDMTQMGDYTFEGEFLTIIFKVKEDIPDGSYPVTISTTDIASWDLVKYEPNKINGEIAVNTEAAAQADMPTDQFTLKVNSQAAKQGDTVTVTIDLANNPGFCGFVIDIEYDANAMTIAKATAGKDFDNAVSLVK